MREASAERLCLLTRSITRRWEAADRVVEAARKSGRAHCRRTQARPEGDGNAAGELTQMLDELAQLRVAASPKRLPPCWKCCDSSGFCCC